MSSKRTVTPIINVPKSSLHDDVEATALKNGFTLNELHRYLAQQQYRKEYNSRPEVVEKRREYRRVRYLRMKELRMVLNQGK